MKMNREMYEDLMLRFAKELNEVGVPDALIGLVKDNITRTPNIASCEKSETTRKFHYRHGGFIIEAEQTVRLMVKKCK